MAATFRDLQTQVFALHRQGRFEEALEAVTQALPELPAQTPRLTYWQACLLCRLGQPEEALAALMARQAEGVWWSPERLTGDPDLAPLRDRPEFAALVEASRARWQRAHAETQPLLGIVEPDTPPPTPLLMAFHMRGGDLPTTLPHWQPATRAGFTVAVPQSSQLFGPDEYEWTDAERAEGEVLEAFRKVQASREVDDTRVVLGGASQGAGLAVRLALRGSPIPARGFVAVVGGGRAEALEPLLAGAAPRGVRGVLITGEHDPARAHVEVLHQALTEAGVEARLEVVPGLGHDYPGDFGARLEAALGFVLAAS